VGLSVVLPKELGILLVGFFGLWKISEKKKNMVDAVLFSGMVSLASS